MNFFGLERSLHTSEFTNSGNGRSLGELCHLLALLCMVRSTGHVRYSSTSQRVLNFCFNSSTSSGVHAAIVQIMSCRSSHHNLINIIFGESHNLLTDLSFSLISDTISRRGTQAAREHQPWYAMIWPLHLLVSTYDWTDIVTKDGSGDFVHFTRNL